MQANEKTKEKRISGISISKSPIILLS